MPDRSNVPHSETERLPPRSTSVREPRGVQKDIANADKKVRSGNVNEAVRDSPPFGDYDETVPKD
jgi:hypothetical protein